MSYVDGILQPGETVLYRGKLHWIIYGSAIFAAVVAVVLAAVAAAGATPEIAPFAWIAAAIAIAIALISAARAWFDQWITEIAVTNFRVVYKKGFIRRHTTEMNMEKVESVTIDQPFWGRLLGYGTVHVLGTGEGIEHLHRVDRPIALRNAIVAR
jgi:uncharacterized membrane protein YdbT with pleckstrin-like domain